MKPAEEANHVRTFRSSVDRGTIVRRNSDLVEPTPDWTELAEEAARTLTTVTTTKSGVGTLVTLIELIALLDQSLKQRNPRLPLAWIAVEAHDTDPLVLGNLVFAAGHALLRQMRFRQPATFAQAALHFRRVQGHVEHALHHPTLLGEVRTIELALRVVRRLPTRTNLLALGVSELDQAAPYLIYELNDRLAATA